LIQRLDEASKRAEIKIDDSLLEIARLLNELPQEETKAGDAGARSSFDLWFRIPARLN